MMKNLVPILFLTLYLFSCTKQESMTNTPAASEILGNPVYRAISYGGYRGKSRQDVPTVDMIIEDLKILQAMGIRIVRTYNAQQFAHAENLIKGIDLLKKKDASFEMYVMLGVWIDCENAWTEAPNHEKGNPINNAAEIEAAVALAKTYPDIVKIIAVGNEAMVHWAQSYWVQPGVILKWVNYLQDLKKEGELPENLWVTSSDNFASWGGGDPAYHKPELIELIRSVDYVSIHTYPFHDTHYNPEFWLDPDTAAIPSTLEDVDEAMKRAVNYARSQYQSVVDFLKANNIDKPVHIGESGWASYTNDLYGEDGSRAADEYKQKQYHDLIREWTDQDSISCFYFEAFDEQWKDAQNPGGSENHFGLINLKGEAKYVLWDLVEAGKFKGLTRGGQSITKTYNGNEEALINEVLPVESKITVEY